MALPPDILRTIKDLERRIRNLETTPQPPSIKLSTTTWATFDISAAGAAGDVILITVTLSDEQNSRLIAVPEFSLYKSGGLPADDRYPFGGNWSDPEIRGLRMQAWMDWAQTDQLNAVYKILLVNEYSSAFTDLQIAIEWRYMTREVTTS